MKDLDAIYDPEELGGLFTQFGEILDLNGPQLIPGIEKICREGELGIAIGPVAGETGFHMLMLTEEKKGKEEKKKD
jgi:hypothetical protein